MQWVIFFRFLLFGINYIFFNSHIYYLQKGKKNVGFMYSLTKFQNRYGFAPFLGSMVFSFNRLPLVYFRSSIQFDADISRFK